MKRALVTEIVAPGIGGVIFAGLMWMAISYGVNPIVMAAAMGGPLGSSMTRRMWVK